MLAEILLQALCQINGPATRATRRDAEKPRRLRRVVLTLPPGMPVFEQQILRSRAGAAVRLVWDMLGWTGSPAAPREPQVVANLDEATATQIVWLHNEVAERFAGRCRRAVRGARAASGRKSAPGRSLRVASIDIGGGTTDLMVTTFTRPAGRTDRAESGVPRELQGGRRRRAAAGDRDGGRARRWSVRCRRRSGRPARDC